VLVWRGRGASGASADLQNALLGAGTRGERWSVITTGPDGTRASEDPSRRPGEAHTAGAERFSQVGAANPVSIDLWPAELSVRLPRLDGSIEASIQEGRRGGAISDG
jgi:hypothetical protein